MPPKSSPRFDAVKGPDKNNDVPSVDSSSDKTNRNILMEFEKSGGSAGPSHDKQADTADISHVLTKNTSDANISKTLINKAFGKTDLVPSEKLYEPQAELNKLFENLTITNENTPTSTPTTSERVTFKFNTPTASERVNFTLGEESGMSQEIILKREASNQTESYHLEAQQEIHPAFREAWQETTQNLEALNQARQSVNDRAQELAQAWQEMQQAGQNILPVIDRFRQAMDRLLPRMNRDHQTVNTIYQDMGQVLPGVVPELDQALQERYPELHQALQDTTQSIYALNRRIDKLLQETKNTFQHIDRLLNRLNLAVPQEPQERNQAVPQERQERDRIQQEVDRAWQEEDRIDQAIDQMWQGMDRIGQDIGQGIGQALHRSIEDLNTWLKNHPLFR